MIMHVFHNIVFCIEEFIKPLDILDEMTLTIMNQVEYFVDLISSIICIGNN